MHQSQSTIFIILQLQFTVRYLLKTDIFKSLNELGYKIIILSPNGLDDSFRQEHALSNVYFEELKLNNYEVYKKNILYRFFLQVRSLTLPGSCDISTMILKEEILLKKIKRFRLSVKVFYHICIFFARLMRSSTLIRFLFIALENVIFKNNAHKELYQKYQPEAILINDLGTIESSNFIMRESRQNNVKIISLILSWDNLVSKGIGALKPDYVIAWNDVMVSELEQYHGIKRDNIYVGGIPHWDSYIKSKINPDYDIENVLGFTKPYGKLIYFATGAPAWFMGNKRTIELLINYIKSYSESHDNGIKLLVRPHPAYFVRGKFKKEIKEMHELVEKNNLIARLNNPQFINRPIGFEFSDEDQILHELFLRECDLLITSYSTLMIEASIFDKPIINVGFDLSRILPDYKTHVVEERETHLTKILLNGFAPVAKTENEFFKLIKTYLNDPSKHSLERREIFNQYVNFNFGNAGESIARNIKEYLG